MVLSRSRKIPYWVRDYVLYAQCVIAGLGGLMVDLTNRNTIEQILNNNGLKPRKGYGQNFLLSQKVITEITESAKLSKNDTVVEIGPGLGTLTQELAKYAKVVLAIESDYKMVEWLRKYFKNYKNVKIIHQDVLQLAISDLRLANYKVVSNLPYNITSPVIRKFLEAQINADLNSNADQRGINTLATHFLRHDSQLLKANSYKLDSMVLMVQKEVAERLCAKPGNRERGILTVMVELFGGAEIVEIVPRSCFYPIPSVDSAIIKISVNQLKICVDPRLFMRFVKVGFSQKRRQIHHPLKAAFHLSQSQIKDILESADIDPTQRAEDLSLDDWIKLYSKIFNL